MGSNSPSHTHPPRLVARLSRAYCSCRDHATWSLTFLAMVHLFSAPNRCLGNSTVGDCLSYAENTMKFGHGDETNRIVGERGPDLFSFPQFVRLNLEISVVASYLEFQFSSQDSS